MSMETIVYAGRAKDRKVLNSCSSGGAFSVLSDDFLNDGNAVLCAGYNFDTRQTEFRMVFTKEDRDACRGSMYMQAYALDSWNEAAGWLSENTDKKLIFFGLGCQGAAFLEFCKKKCLEERVTIVDIICHGVPSPMIWKEYANTLEKKGKFEAINFRDKRTGWNKSIGIGRINAEEISLSKWRKAYSTKTMTRPSCYHCPYNSIERNTDITIGDFWHLEEKMPDFYDEMGTSLFLVHTEKGRDLFERIKDSMDYRQSNIKDCWQKNLEGATTPAADRKDFWSDYRKHGIDFVMEKYGTVNFRRKLQRKIRSVLNRF